MIQYFRPSSGLDLIFDKSQTFFNLVSFDFVFIFCWRAGRDVIALDLESGNRIQNVIILV